MNCVASSLLILSLVVQPAPALAQLKPPPLGNQEAGGAVATAEGKVRWKNSWTMERVTSDGTPAVHFVETGQGRYSPFTEEVRWNTESWWSNDGAFRPLRFNKTFSDTAGTPIMRETAEFDWKRHVVKFDRKDLRTGKDSSETINIPDDTISVEGIAAALRGVPMTMGARVTANLLSNEPKLYEITLEVDKRETCRTSRGPADCFRVELVPDLGALNLFKFAFPKTYFWYAAAAPHEWLRYEGLEAGRGTPEIVMEPAETEPPRVSNE
jgi:hypothetical protein